MCGIAGWLGTLPDGHDCSERMLMSLHHRGPDSRGVQSWPEATLLHTRLSIIDLSAAGSQPIANQERTVWTVFNGEIYNHRELRHDLEKRGHVFRSRSDSEVLPHLYEAEGSAFVAKLRGMFAFAIYDTRTRSLLLVRDRFGIKPLFYAVGSNRLAFASEINALRQLPDVDLRPDPQAIYDFSALFYIPAPETFYSGIRALQPGEMLEARLDSGEVSWKVRRYHCWTITPNQELRLGEATKRTEQLIACAVHNQVESDVPLGSLLSGGIDSSLVSASAQGALAGNLRTFNVRFPDKDYDETWAALAVAQHIASQHTTLDMNSISGTWDHITGLLRHAGQPYADTSLFAAHAVCQRMREHVTVALSGDGGDEAFGGYQHYWQLGRIDRVQSLPAFVLQGLSMFLTAAERRKLVFGHMPQRVRELIGADDIATVQKLFSWIREDEHRRLWRDEGKVLPIRRLFELQWTHTLAKDSSRLERLSAYATEANVRLVLPNDFLFKVDTASMREGLEVRVPMLDEDLFDFGLSLSHRLKVQGRTCKRVLRAVADRWLPRQVARKPKMGFGIPVDSWVDSAFKVRLKDELLRPTCRLRQYFRPEAYHPLIEAFCLGKPYPTVSRQGLYQRTIMLLSLHLALDGTPS